MPTSVSSFRISSLRSWHLSAFKFNHRSAPQQKLGELERRSSAHHYIHHTNQPIASLFQLQCWGILCDLEQISFLQSNRFTYNSFGSQIYFFSSAGPTSLISEFKLTFLKFLKDITRQVEWKYLAALPKFYKTKRVLFKRIQIADPLLWHSQSRAPSHAPSQTSCVRLEMVARNDNSNVSRYHTIGFPLLPPHQFLGLSYAALQPSSRVLWKSSAPA